MTKDVKITIRTDTPFRPWRLFFPVAFAYFLILPGHFLDIPAMEWLGFLAVVVTGVFGVPLAVSARNTSLSFDEARKLIDEIESKCK